MRFPLGLSSSLSAYIARRRIAGDRFVPLVLMLEPLFACNLNCSTCGRIREYRDDASRMMSVEECLKAATECEAPVVSVCGGEPLVYPEIGELVELLVDMGRYVYLCTNGVLLSASLEKFRPSGHFLLNVHLDGPSEVHDAIVERDGAFDASVEGIDRAVRRGFQVTVNTTVCRQTDMGQIDSLMHDLASLGVRSFMLSPAYSYDSVENKEWFMSREDVHRKFADIDAIASRHRLADSPIYLEFLRGKRELQCTAWGSPTRNVRGWRSPCYLIADNHLESFEELIESTDWESYGADRDPRCKDCMMHCGYEPTAALMLDRKPGDIWKMIRWQFG